MILPDDRSNETRPGLLHSISNLNTLFLAKSILFKSPIQSDQSLFFFYSIRSCSKLSPPTGQSLYSPSRQPSPLRGCAAIENCHCERPLGAKQSDPQGRHEASERNRRDPTLRVVPSKARDLIIPGLTPPLWARDDFVGLLRSLLSLAMTMRFSLLKGRGNMDVTSLLWMS
jgi:hypothetical protein